MADRFGLLIIVCNLFRAGGARWGRRVESIHCIGPVQFTPTMASRRLISISSAAIGGWHQPLKCLN